MNDDKINLPALLGMAATDRQARFQDLIAEGLTFAECVKIFAERQGDDERQIAQRAVAALRNEDDIDFDDDPIVSRGEGDGEAYVMAWVWVGTDR